MDWNRVYAIGRETYIRLYPNPGFGLSFGQWRIAVSWYGGFELFKARPPRRPVVWDRVWSLLSRVQRPGGR